MLTLVLASASPRRRKLLTQASYVFTVHPAHIPEDPYANEDPIAYVTSFRGWGRLLFPLPDLRPNLG